MFRTASTLPVAAAAIAAATVIAACGSNSPSSSGSPSNPTEAQIQQEQRDLIRFASCMRSHGVPNIPDPTTSPRAFKGSLTTQSPAFRSAAMACQHLLPGGRLNPPRQSTSHSQAQIAAALAFARCIRGHGFPTFPDPTPTGDISHAMLANAGINLHQPAVLQAADACVSVTHGLLTRTDVARFVAGQAGS
jgi:hypothetical protein